MISESIFSDVGHVAAAACEISHRNLLRIESIPICLIYCQILTKLWLQLVITVQVTEW